MSDDVVDRLRTLKYLSNYQYAVVQDAIAKIESLRSSEKKKRFPRRTKEHLDKFEWVGAIETASGKEFNILDPGTQMFDIQDIATSLSHICRYNGHLPHFYSVAEHSVRVAWWLRVQGEDPATQLTGLLHDAAEAYVGDMVRPLKRTSEVGLAYQQIEEKVLEMLHSVYGGIYPHPPIVKAADRAIYDWELEHIRTGQSVGMSPKVARDAFLKRYYYTLSDLRRA